MKLVVSRNHRLCFSVLLLVVLSNFISGCIDVSDEALQEQQWKQANPNWQSPVPQNGNPQGSIFGYPKEPSEPYTTWP
jgi:hypothetical protein